MRNREVTFSLLARSSAVPRLPSPGLALGADSNDGRLAVSEVRLKMLAAAIAKFCI
jgi:hypothetical protein